MKKLTKAINCFIVTLLAAFLFVTITPLNSVGTENTSVAVAATKISTKNVSIPLGKTYTLKVTGTSKTIKWYTSNKRVATVKNGVVTAKKSGTTIITAKVGNKRYICRVTVLSYKINSNNVIMTKGKTYTLKVTGLPKKTKATFKSSKTSVATVDKKTGKITGKKNGTATITVSVGKKSFPVLVKVETPTLNKTKLALAKKKSYTLKVNTTRKVKWKSSNTSVASVSSSGKVTAKKNGSSVITATLSDRTLSCIVTVNNKTVINCPSTITVKLGQTISYKIKTDDDIDYSVGKDYVDIKLNPSYYQPGDTITMNVTGKFVGTDTITFICDDGWKKVINVKVTGTSIKASTVATTMNHVKVNSIKAYKGVGTKPILNITSSFTYNNTTPLDYIGITYSIYDVNNKVIDTCYKSIKKPVKGRNYNINFSINPDSSLYPKGAYRVTITKVEGGLPASYRDKIVKSKVPVTISSNTSSITVTNINLQQKYYNNLSNEYTFDYSFEIQNNEEYNSAYVYFYFYDKNGKEIPQDYTYYDIIFAKPKESGNIKGALYGVVGDQTYGDIASIKVVIGPDSIH